MQHAEALHLLAAGDTQDCLIARHDRDLSDRNPTSRLVRETLQAMLRRCPSRVPPAITTVPFPSRPYGTVIILVAIYLIPFPHANPALVAAPDPSPFAHPNSRLLVDTTSHCAILQHLAANLHPPKPRAILYTPQARTCHWGAPKGLIVSPGPHDTRQP